MENLKNNTVYIHIPFCEEICSYCDFCKFYYNKDIVDKYLVALKKEIKLRYKGENINNIYIGGGTPSCLSKIQIKELLGITNLFNKDIKEFTFECNIENITEDKVKILKEYGVNRISLGVQTFNNKFLNFLNRKHTSREVKNKINMIKKYINNINIDIIYAIPGETIEDIENDISEYLKLDIEHISTYSLIIEKNTILNNLKVEYIDDELDYKMYKKICSILKNNGYNHYEISNFAKKGYESKHNLVYWNNEHYYGFGLSASGYIDNIRYTNTKTINKYLSGEYIKEEESLNINETIENEFILGFRKLKGISINKLKKKYNLDITKIDFINKLLEEKKIIIKNNYLSIRNKYIYVSNDILLEFMGVDYEKYI